MKMVTAATRRPPGALRAVHVAVRPGIRAVEGLLKLSLFGVVEVI
jgi:hypothetical protein